MLGLSIQYSYKAININVLKKKMKASHATLDVAATAATGAISAEQAARKQPIVTQMIFPRLRNSTAQKRAQC